MKRRTNPPSSKYVFSGKYDSDFLITPYQRLFIGYSNNRKYRQDGSSGGVGSELASYILKSGLVDVVVGVGFSKNDPTLPIYQAITSPEDVHKISGSKYVYMEYKSLLDLLSSYNNEKIAVFVQPCFVKAIRNYQKHKLPNIRYIFSFFCGYNKAYDGTEYLIKKTKLKKNRISCMSYRWGEYPGGFMVKSKSGKIVHFGKECYELVDLMFLKDGCRICPYYMGEGADVVFGDAWVKNLKNGSVIITRNDTGTNVISNMYSEGKIKLYFLNENNLVIMHWHNLKFKKYGLSLFLSFLHSVLSTKLAKYLTPFRFMMMLSRFRRKFAIRISVDLREINKNNLALQPEI
ncbi:MAG: Coenzyme F420 hydrogenase/dehydrogenase, beta subunit C-terminal domain [Bacteroidetes bacterium]|nr:Coenzyme F420 hydrogenase/dehydrogenase, beta subunit C-terminal domain [Bacteroidota bacterium]